MGSPSATGASHGLSAAQVAALSERLRVDGYALLDDFLSAQTTTLIRGAIEDAVLRDEVIHVARGNLLGRQRFSTINGAQALALPELARLCSGVCDLLCAMTGERFEPVHVPEIAVSVNVVQEGGAFSPHYDRHELTAILYLDEPRGGEFYMWPLYRRLWPGRRRLPMKLLQGVTDLLSFPAWVRSRLGRRVEVAPRPGRLVLMWGSRTLHGVAPLRGGAARHSVQFGYDRPGVRYGAAAVARYYGTRAQAR